MPANGTANLKPAKKGEVRNPNGNNGSDDRYLTGLIRKSAKEIAPGQENIPHEKRKTRGELFVEKLWEEALTKKSSDVAWRILTERCDGRLPVAITGEGGGPIKWENALSDKTDEELDLFIAALETRKAAKANGSKTHNGKKLNGHSPS